MSGGSLGSYDYFKISDFLDSLERVILRAEGERKEHDTGEWVISENPLVIESFKLTLELGKEFIRFAKAADWLAAGDYDDDSYLREVSLIVMGSLPQKAHQYD